VLALIDRSRKGEESKKLSYRTVMALTLSHRVLVYMLSIVLYSSTIEVLDLGLLAISFITKSGANQWTHRMTPSPYGYRFRIQTCCKGIYKQ
jgi:hypothetical protein